MADMPYDLNVHGTLDAAREMYDVLMGNLTLYVDEYGIFWNNQEEPETPVRVLSPEEFIRSAEIELDFDYTGYVSNAKLSFESPSYNGDVTIDLLMDTITVSNYGTELMLSYNGMEHKYPLLETLLEMHENAVL